MKRLLSLMVLTGWCAVAYGADFTLTSPQFKDGGDLTKTQEYQGFGCHGENVSPALKWSGAPEGTKSFAVTLYDPDAPTGSGWWHWLIFNIPADVHQLKQGAGDPTSDLAPKGVTQSRTDYGKPGYGGPCPPKGDKPHHYQFRVFALDVKHLDLPKDIPAAQVGYNLNAHKLGEAELTGLYQR